MAATVTPTTIATTRVSLQPEHVACQVKPKRKPCDTNGTFPAMRDVPCHRAALGRASLLITRHAGRHLRGMLGVL